MPKIKNSGLDQYGTEPLEQQQFGTAGVEGVKENYNFTHGSTPVYMSIQNRYIVQAEPRGF